MVHPNEYLGAGQGLAVPTKIIKQADVVMMLELFKTRFPAEIEKANWEYYEPRTEHGSSLSACAYAMLAAEFGDLDFAYKYFLKTAKIDLEAKYAPTPLFRVSGSNKRRPAFGSTTGRECSSRVVDFVICLPMV